MPTINQVFPRRPLTVTLPKPGLRARLWAIFGILFLIGCAAALVNWALPSLITDVAVRDTAIAVRGRVESGKCHSKLIFHICDVTLVNGSVRPEIRRDVTYVFTDLHLGNYNAQVMADPDHPAWVTSDLGIDSLLSRMLTMGAFAALVLAALVLGLRRFFRAEARKAAVKAISGQLMIPVPLTLLGFSANKNASGWTVQVGPEKPERWDFPGAAKPFVMGPETHILGVTSLSGGIVVPLDADLSWVDFTDAERAAIRVADHE